MKMKLTLIAALVISLGTATVASAAPCTMTPEKAPTLFGFKLGMTQTAAEKLSGQKADDNGILIKTSDGWVNADTGDKYIVIFNEDGRSKVLDKTVEKMGLTFMDGKLFEMSPELTSYSPWVKAPDRLAFFQKQFGIPTTAWVDDGEPGRYYTLNKKVTCNGIAIAITAGKAAMKFKITETAVAARIEQAKEAAREKYADK
jgi:hypothetical protein